MDIHVYFHNDPHDEIELRGRLDQIISSLHALTVQGKKMDQAIQDVLDQVAAVKGDVASTKAFISAMETRITEILANENLKPETRDALATAFSDLKGASQELKDAIDNDPSTPPAPNPVP
jgi:DNA-binding FrmR family transcriptional regulator